MNLSNKRLPTLLGVIILIAVVVLGIYLIGNQKEKPEYLPKEINISNLTDNRFSVSWVTDEPTMGVIRYGTTPSLETTTKDDRDQISGESGKYLTHHVTINNLKPKTKYYFKIGSRNEKKLYDNNGSPYEITTGSTISDSSPVLPINGRILNPDNNPAEGVLVYLTANNILPQSTLTDKDGRWIIFLNKARSINIDENANIDPKATTLTIKAFDKKKSTTAQTVTAYASPLPDLVLGHPPYDFREKGEEEAQTMPEEIAVSQPSSPAGKFAIQQPEAFPATPHKEVAIVNPSFDGEQLNTLKPDIKGTGPVDKVLTIRIESSKSYTAAVTIDKDGSWNYIPPENLSPGQHKVTVSYIDDGGEEQTLTRQFVVLAAGQSQLPAFEATPSATATPSAPPRVSRPSTESGVPETGVVEPTIIVLLAGLILIGLGIFFPLFANNFLNE